MQRHKTVLYQGQVVMEIKVLFIFSTEDIVLMTLELCYFLFSVTLYFQMSYRGPLIQVKDSIAVKGDSYNRNAPLVSL